jgi:hypothetical protein
MCLLNPHVAIGSKVFLADIDETGARAVADELNKKGQVVWPMKVDVAEWDS